jgi:hypothetical protein
MACGELEVLGLAPVLDESESALALWAGAVAAASPTDPTSAASAAAATHERDRFVPSIIASPCCVVMNIRGHNGLFALTVALAEF